MKNRISVYLQNNPLFLITWCITAAFGAYFCTYAFRKPFSTGLYSEYVLWGMNYKTILVITQVFGYMCSKFIGVKVISELSSKNRIYLITSLIGIAAVSLLLFGLVPYPYNWVFLFFNGLPLGMIWGVIFSFLEGRRFTELIGLGLSINMIATSGILKSIYLYFYTSLNISEFWMPIFMGMLFSPIMVLCIWMLAQIPEPNAIDISLRSKRIPMNKFEKKKIMYQYGLGILCLIGAYTIFTITRDFRDNFSVEIWKEIAPDQDFMIFSKVESLIALIVMLIISSFILIKPNYTAYLSISLLMIGVLVVGGVITISFQSHQLDAFTYMTLLGICLFLPYLLIQIAVFERLIALFKIRGNAGFLVYLCDSIGYLGSVCVLLYKEFFVRETSWATMLIQFNLVASILAGGLIIAQLFFFVRQYHVKRGSILKTAL